MWKRCVFFKLISNFAAKSLQMAGLYLHIPFCKSRCIYCGFYSTTFHDLMEEYVDALCREMSLRKEQWHRQPCPINTIYLGGGTPSQLSPALLHRLFHNIYKVYEVSADAEITIECNPDDITPEYAEALKALPVNRVSMGAQTFSDDRLRFLHRRHTSDQVRTAVDMLRRNDIHNISIDLMFGFPQETIDDWQEDIRRALELDVEHLSAYCLMIEEGTVLYEMMREERGGRKEERGERREEGEMRKEEGEERREEELERQMYETLIDSLESAGYEHYEISNFAREGFRSRHNSSYWNGTPYMGIGAAAHSYDVSTRYWNVSDIRQYIRRLKQGSLAIEETEEIDDITRYNDLITTALRTREGIDLSLLSAPKKDSLASGKAMPSFHRYLLENAEPHLHNGLLKEENHHIHLTRRGLFISDTIMSDLIYV